MSRRAPFVALALLLTMASAATLTAQHLDHTEKHSLIVTGEGEVRATPDLAVLRVGAVAQAESAQRAQAQVDEIVERTIEAIVGLDVPRQQIQTRQVMLWPVYSNERPPRPLPAGEDEPQEEPRIVGFRASSTLEIRVEDLAKTGEVLGTAVSAGANQLEGLSFELRDDTEQKREALKQAVASARAKAEAIAEALEMELGPVIGAKEGGAQVEPVRVQGARMMAAEDATMAVPVQPGEVAVRASVTLRHRLGAAD